MKIYTLSIYLSSLSLKLTCLCYHLSPYFFASFTVYLFA